MYFAIISLGLSIFFRLMLWPAMSRLRSINEQIENKKAGIKRCLQVLAYKERIIADRKKYASFLKKIEDPEEDAMTLMKEIERIANKSGLYVSDMKPAGVKNEKNGAKRILVNLACEATMEQLIEFIYGMETSSQLITIERYQISPKTKGSSIAQCLLVVAKISL